MANCPKCGAIINSADKFCTGCGSLVSSEQMQSVARKPVPSGQLTCPKCHSTNISVQTFQEQKKSVTTGVSSSNIKEKRHGFIWWLFVGWWWSIIKGILWIVAFIPMAIIRAGRRKKYTATTKSVNTTVNQLEYRVVCTCQNCGNIWKK